MIKIFLAFFISLAYATESPEPKDEAIEKTPTSRFDQLDSDTFYRIMTFLSAEKVLNLRFLSRGIYRRVRNIWPEMELFTIMDMRFPGRSAGFSHNIKICGIDLERQNFPYNRAQLSCLREFTFKGSGNRNLQTVVNLLPRDSLTSLRLENSSSVGSLISEIDFPKLTHLELSLGISLNHATFGSLPNCKVLKLISMVIDDTTSFSFATALGAMDKLEALSIWCCIFHSKGGFSAILENLPASLKSLDIDGISFLDYGNKLSELGLKRLKEMEHLQKISFVEVSNGIAIEIILNLPKCTTSIYCDMNRETLNAFKKRSSGFTNVKQISFCYVASSELHPIIREIFPNLDENIKERLVSSL